MRRIKTKTVVANTLILKDQSGQIRMHFDASDESGRVGINMFGTNHSAIAISIDPNNHCSIALSRPNGGTALALGMKPDGRSGLDLYDAAGKPSAMISSDRGRTPTLITIFGPAVVRRLKKSKVQRKK
jgi:hypothetical protein